MFGIFLLGFDLHDPVNFPKFFNFTLLQETYTNGFRISSRIDVPLVRCTPQHFDFTPELSNLYTKIGFHTGFCPPLDYEFTLKGKSFEDPYKQFRILVERCNPSVDSTCASDTIYALTEAMMGGKFDALVPIVNTNVNPSS